MRMFHALAGVVLFSCGLHGERWALERQTYFEPMISEPRAARISLGLPVYATVPPYSQNPGKFWGWDISLGAELPVVGFDSRKDRRTQLTKGQQGFALLTPVHFHVIEDLTSHTGPSAPILNTDYRFGTMIKYAVGLSDDSRFAVRFVPWAHESTHLGDEYTLSARQQPGFKRINVSYEYWELAGALTADRCFGLRPIIWGRAGDEDDSCRTTVRLGYLRPLPGVGGYYSRALLAPEGAKVFPSVNDGEWHAGAEILPLPQSGVRYRPFLSLDARYRPVYNYEKTAPGQPEDRRMSVNVMVGVTKRGADKDAGVPMNVFFRFYNGVNPNGQFRNQRSFTLIGVGIHVPVL